MKVTFEAALDKSRTPHDGKAEGYVLDTAAVRAFLGAFLTLP